MLIFSKRRLIIFFLIALPIQSLAAKVESPKIPDTWFILPEDRRSNQITSEDPQSQSKSEEGLANTLDRLYQTHQTAFEKLSEPKLEIRSGNYPKNWSPWHLNSIVMDLGLTAQGLFGLMTIKGTPAVSVIWRKKEIELKTNAKIQTLSEVQSNESKIPTGTISGDAQDSSILAQIEPIYQTVVASGKVKDSSRFKENLLRTASQLNELVQSLDTPSDSEWWVSGFRFDFLVSASGTITPIWMALGGELRIRLEWRRLKRSQPHFVSRNNSFAVYRENLQQLIQSMESVIETAATQPSVSGSLQLVQMRVGLGSTVEGNFGIAKGSFSTIGHLIYSKDPRNPNQTAARSTLAKARKTSEASYTIPLIENNPPENHIEFAKTNQIQYKIMTNSAKKQYQQAVYQLPKEKIVKGLQKALKLASFFSNRPSNPNRKWQIAEVRSSFDLSLTGSLGFASITGTFSTLMHFR